MDIKKMNEENMKVLLGVVLSVLSDTQLKEVNSKLDKLEKEIKEDLEKFKDEEYPNQEKRFDPNLLPEKTISKPSYLG